MITLVKHHTANGIVTKSVTETFDTIDSALIKFHQYLSNYAADTTVSCADVVLLNDSLIPCKSEHYVREMPPEETTDEV